MVTDENFLSQIRPPINLMPSSVFRLYCILSWVERFLLATVDLTFDSCLIEPNKLQILSDLCPSKHR